MAKAKDELILEKLDQILRVLALQVGADLSLTDRARYLKLAGLDNHTIASLLGTTAATVSTLTTNLYKSKKR
jgi:DNA-binding NarL/FixJ family response regulator